MKASSDLSFQKFAHIRDVLLDVKVSRPLTTDVVEGQVWYNSAAGQKRIEFRDNVGVVLVPRLDYVETVTAAWSFSSNFTVGSSALVVNLNANFLNGYNSNLGAVASTVAVRDTNGRILANDPSGTVNAELVTYGFLYNFTQGQRQQKQACVALYIGTLPAYTFASNTITATANGAINPVDGITLAVNDRLAIVNETGTNQPYNGIYVVTQIGSPTLPFILQRASDANTSAQVVNGMQFWVTEGTVNGDSGWLLTTPNPITLNTTNLTFVQNNGAAQIIAGSGIGRSGNTIYVSVGASSVYPTNKSFIYNDTASTLAALGGSGIPQLNGAGVPTVVSGTQYGVVYWATATTIGTTLAGTSTQVLHGNVAGAPTWSAVSLTADVSGVLPIGNGGTNNGALSVALGNIVYTDGSKLMSGGGTNNQFVRWNTSGAPGTFDLFGTANTFTASQTIALNSADSILYLSAAATLNQSGRIETRTARGTIAAPTISQNGDVACQLFGNVYDGAAYQQIGAIQMAADGAPALNNTPGKIVFYTNAGGTTLTARLTIDHLGNVNVAGLTASSLVQTDASKNLISSNTLPAGTSISGFTSGSVIFAGAAGALTQDNANFFWDSTNKRVGIGTINPGQPFVVTKDGVVGSGNWINVAGFSNSATTKGVYLGYDNVALLGVVASYGVNSGLEFWSHNGSWGERMRIDTAGNIGIGTTTPGYLLDVAGIARVQSNLYVSGNVGLGTTGPISFLSIGVVTALKTNIGITLGNGQGNIEFLGSSAVSGYGHKIYSIDTGASRTDLRIAGRNNSAVFSDMVTVTSLGNVGIGTVNPQQILTLGSGLNFAVEMVTPTVPTITNVGTTGTTTYTYTVTALDGVGETVASIAASTTLGNAVLSATNYNTISWTAVTGAASYNVYRTVSGGTPATTGKIGSSTGTSLNDTGLAGSGASPTVTSAYVGKIAASGSSWLLGGNLGIGTAVPLDLIHLSGGTLRVAVANDGSGIKLISTSTVGNKSALYHTNQAGTERWRMIFDPAGNKTDDLQFIANNNGTTVLVLSQSGLVTPGADAIQDFGASGTRWNNGYFVNLKASTAIGINAVPGTTTELTITQPIRTSGSPTSVTWTGGAHTTLTLGVESVDVNFNAARTVQFTGSATAGAANITLQRAFLVQAPTYSFSSTGAQTITDAATVAISGAPIAGTNATITNAWALMVQGGASKFTGNVTVTGTLTVSGFTTGSIIYAGTGGALSQTTLTGILKGNGSSAPTAVTGAVNTVAKWGTSGQTLVNSNITDNGNTITLAPANQVAVLSGGATSITQLQLGDLSVFGAISTRYSSGSLIISSNASQPTYSTDTWSKSATSWTSLAFDLIGNSATSTTKFSFLVSPLTSANATYTTFWTEVANINYSGALTLASGITLNGANTITTSTGQLDIRTGGGNANVVLTPNGSGATILNGNVGVGTISPSATLDMAPPSRSGNSGVTGNGWFSIRAGTYTDSQTASSGTSASFAFSVFSQPTLAATNTLVTTTNCATVYIANAPTAGTNMTLTNALALWIGGGASRFDGGVTITSGGLTVSGGNLTVSALVLNNVLYVGASGLVSGLAVNSTATTKFLTQVSSGAPLWFDLFGTANTFLSVQTVEIDSSGPTVSNGLKLINTTNAALNNQQYSPALYWRGQGWQTNTSGSQPTDFRVYVTPVQGAASPGARLIIDSQINNAGWTNVFSMKDTGEIVVGTWNATLIGAVYGGTGFGSYAVNDMLYASASTALARLGSVASRVLTTSGTGVPTWASDLPGGTTLGGKSLASASFGTVTGNGTSTTLTYTHNLNLTARMVQVRYQSTGELVLVDWKPTVGNLTTQVDLVFQAAPASGDIYEVSVAGW